MGGDRSGWPDRDQADADVPPGDIPTFLDAALGYYHILDSETRTPQTRPHLDEYDQVGILSATTMLGVEKDLPAYQ